MMRRLILFVFCLFIFGANQSYSATGDVLGTSLISTSPGDYGCREIVTGIANGCYSDTGVCAKLNAADGNCTAFFDINVTDAPEVTIVWYEKYDVWPLTWSSGGCKSIRPFNGGSDENYLAALITFFGSNTLYGTVAYGATTGLLTPTAAMGTMSTSGDYCQSNGDGTYDCATHWKSYNMLVGGVGGMGTNWRKMRQYVKVPSTIGSTDGETKLWIDDELIYTLVNFDRSGGGANITSIRLAPIDESATAHGHWYDDMTTYEGYVPPTDEVPTVTSAAVNGSTATINFSEPVVTSGYDAADFNLDCSTAGTDISLTSPSGSDSSRTFTVASSIGYGDTCNLDYVGGADDIEGTTGDDLVTFSNTAVTNNTQESSGNFKRSGTILSGGYLFY